MLTIPELKAVALRLLLLCLSPVTASAQPFCTVRTFTIRDGLSANVVTSADQTGSGMMWFATWNGLCSYDGYSFLSFRDAWGDQGKLTTNRINTIATSANNNVWLLNYDRQAALFDTHTNKFVDVTGLIEKQYGRQLEVETITPLPNGHTWVMGERSYSDIYRIDDSRVTDGEGIEHYKFADPRLKGCTVIKVRLDRHGREWLVTTKGVQQAGGRMVLAGRYDLYGEAGGSVFFASVHGRVAMVKGKGSKAVPLAMPKGVANVYCLTHSGNTILLGTNVGVVAYDTRTGKTRLMSVQTPAQPLKDVRWMYADSRQRLWVFNDTKGVVMLDLRNGSARWMHAVSSNHMLKTPSTKPFVHEDSHGTLWMVPWRGTFCYYDEQKKSLVENSLNNKGFDPLSGLFIDSWFVDRQKNLWFTGQHNLSLVNFDYQRMQIVPVERGEETRALFYDSKRQLWVGTNTGAVAVYDMDGQCKGYLNKQGQLQKGFTRLTRKVYAIYEDNRHRMWIGTKGYGLFCLTPKGSLRHYKYDARDKFSISHDSVYDIYQDSRGRLWVGTHGGGLNVLDESGGKVRFISHRNIKTNYDKDCYRVRRITSMRNGVMLVATTNGLVTFSDNPSNPEKIRFYCSKHVMGDTTSLASNDVMQAFVTSGGRVFLATMGSGLQEVVGSNMLKDQLKVRRIKSLWLNDGMVQSMFEDHGKLWMVRGNVVNAYDLNKNQVIPFRDRIYGRQLDFTEAKPAYDPVTHRAWLGVMGGYLSAQPCKVSRSHYVPQILFTGVQHEGELSPRPILNQPVLDVPANKRNLIIMFAALDFTDSHNIRYAYKLDGEDKKWTFVGSVHSTAFNQLSAGHHRLLVRSTNSDGVWVDNTRALDIYVHPTFWETIWAKILYMLLFFGLFCVAVYISWLRSRSKMEKEVSEIKTSFFTDMGHKLRTPLTLISGPVTEALNDSNLPEGVRHHLEMVQRNARNMLLLVNRMIDYANTSGYMVYDKTAPAFARTVDKNGGQGTGDSDNAPSTSLVCGDGAGADNVFVDGNVAAGSGSAKGSGSGDGEGDREFTLLVVEDNDDLRDFLVGILRGQYNVLEAENGKVGLLKTNKYMPDLIITDVMMPLMDGLQMVREIKHNSNLCHIPIVVLSAKASLNDRLEGLKEGIDDYITKPFSATYLKQRVENIIAQRQMLQRTYLESFKVEDHAQVPDVAAVQKEVYHMEAAHIDDADREMMKKLMAYLDENISNPNLKIDDLAEAVNLGRTIFYGKMKSTVGIAPVDFVRRMRIQRAEELICKSTLSLSEIAYAVGFADPKYFTKVFKRETGITPSEYREKGNS